jgi:nicotinate-nucleotide adenylyltransferase
MSKRHIALYGGSFDPPHLGHVLSVAWTLSAADIDEVWVVPTWKHPFDKQHGAPFEARLEMCVQAFGMFRDVQISPIEQRLGGVSRTLRTIETLGSEHPEVAFRLLVGADVLPSVDRWHRWDEITRLAPPIVIGRQGYPVPDGCPISIPDVSSTDIRKRLSIGSDLFGLVPAAVLAHIRNHGLYRDEP